MIESIRFLYSMWLSRLTSIDWYYWINGIISKIQLRDYNGNKTLKIQSIPLMGRGVLQEAMWNFPKNKDNHMHYYLKLYRLVPHSENPNPDTDHLTGKLSWRFPNFGPKKRQSQLLPIFPTAYKWQQQLFVNLWFTQRKSWIGYW